VGVGDERCAVRGDETVGGWCSILESSFAKEFAEFAAGSVTGAVLGWMVAERDAERTFGCRIGSFAFCANKPLDTSRSPAATRIFILPPVDPNPTHLASSVPIAKSCIWACE